MTVYIMLFTTVLLIFISKSLGISTTEHYAYHVRTLDSLFFNDEYFISVSTEKSVKRCLLACGEKSDCVTFSFKPDVRQCRLYSTGFYDSSVGTAEGGWLFYKYSDASCPVENGFVQYRTTSLCLYISPVSKAFTSASDTCAGLGGRLLTIESSAKQSALAPVLEILRSKHSTISVGLQKNGGWYWVNGEAVTHSVWGLGQPVCYPSGSVCDCAEMVSAWNWQWNDCQCDKQTFFMCEYVEF